MENQPEQNQQSVSGGQAMQVNDPQAPVIQADRSTININQITSPRPEPPVSETPQNLPYSGVVAFVGRETELERVHEGLQREQSVSISAIAGMGGIGKTELALQYARKHCREGSYPGGLCWIRAREEVGTQILSFVRSLLNLTPPEDLELVEKVRWCWGRWREGAALLVFDDVQKYEDVELFLPPQDSRFKVLMTTRSHFGFPVQELPLDVLTEKKALELLRSLVQDERVDRELERSKELCEWLGCLPLGVELVGRYLAKRKDVSIELLWQRLQEQRLEARAFKQAEPGMTASLGVAAAFELSWQSLDEVSQQVAAVLSLFALVEIPWKLVEQCLPEVDAEELEDIRDQVLLGANLLKRVDQGMYQLHQLVREFFASKREQRSDEEKLERKFYEVVIAEAERVSEKPERSLIKESTVMIAHLQAAINLLDKLEQELNSANCSFWIAELCKEQGDYNQAERSYLRSLSIREYHLGNDHLDVALVLHSLALLYSLKGRYNEAKSLLEQVVSIREHHLGNDHLEVATSLEILAEVWAENQNYEVAKSLHIRVLEIYQKQLSDEHPKIASVLIHLGGIHREQGDYDEAELLYKRVLEINQQALSLDHPNVASTLNELALLYEFQGRYDKSESLYARALDIRQRYYGDNHPKVAISLANLAHAYIGLEQYSRAEPYFVKALEIFQQRLGDDHPEITNILDGLAKTYYFQERYEEAESRWTRVVEIRRQQYHGDNHSYVATSLSNLARVYVKQERLSEAESLFLRALGIYQQTLSDTHSFVAINLEGLANLYAKQERYRETEDCYLKSLLILVRGQGEDSRLFQKYRENFRSLLQKAIQENRTDELSDDPMTRSMLQELQSPSD